MRFKPLGKVVVFALILGGLWEVWRHAPPALRRHGALPVASAPGLLPAQGHIEAPPVVEHIGTFVGYTGSPPLATAGLPHGATGANSITAVGEASPRSVVEGIQSGQLDAGVVDLPTFVYAAQSGESPGRIVLLVSWREGSDVLAVRSGGAWKPSDKTAFVAGTSGEYMSRRVIETAHLSPDERETAESNLKPVSSLNTALKSADAIAGRSDQIGTLPAGWREVESTTGADIVDRMPDVLVVNDRWAREHPERVTSLVRQWLVAQSLKHTGNIPETAAPTLRDQIAFVSSADGKVPVCQQLAARQALLTAPSGPTPQEAPTVLVDGDPLSAVIGETQVR